MRYESLHGLVFTTDLEGIGECVSAEGAAAELAFVVGDPWERVSDSSPPLVTEWVERGRAIVLGVRGVGHFDVTRERIVVRPESGSRADLVRLFARYHALGLALRLRGFVVLHGAAVSVGGGARVWVGESGAGKTSAALEACAAGGRFLADEVVALEARGSAFVVRRGIPWPRIDSGAPARLHALARAVEFERAPEVPLAAVALAPAAASGGAGLNAALRGAALAAQILGGYRPELAPTAEEIALRSRVLAEVERLRR